MIETEEIDMLEIGNTIVSLDLFTKYFICDYKACKGICCEEGDGGAPLTAEEDEKIKSILPEILPLLPRKAKEIIEKQENINESLNMQINELASLDKIQEVAKNIGLSYNNDNIKIVTE